MAQRPFLVRQLLEDAGFEVELVAGAAGLERECRGVYIGEHLDPTPWMASGGVHLTAGLALVGQDPAEGRRLVRRLHAAGMVGLGISIPHYLSDIPTAMRDEADAVGLPLFAVTGETLFREIEQYVYDVLASEEMQRLRRSLSAQQQLLETLASGVFPGTLVARLSSLLGGGVALTDPDGAILVSSGIESAPPVDVGEAWAACRAAARSAPPRPAVRAGGRPLLWREVVVDGRVRMMVLASLDEAATSDEFSGATLDYAQRLLEIELRRRLDPDAGAGGALLRDVLVAPEAATSCAARLALRGIDDETPFRLIVLRPLIRPDGVGNGESLASGATLEGAAAFLRTHGARYVMAPSGDGGVVLLLACHFDGEASVAGLVSGLGAVLAADGNVCAAGVSEECHDLRAAARAHSHALQALADLASISDDGECVRWYEKFSPRRRVFDGLGDAELEEFSGRLLGPLRRADGGGAGGLIESVRATLRHDASIADASLELGVHRNTLCKRLARVHKLTGLDLGCVDGLTDARLALEAHDILGCRQEARAWAVGT